MSALDFVVHHKTATPYEREQARAELSALRAQAAEAETLRATVAEQAAIIKEQQQDIAYITAREAAVVENHRKANAEQARQLEQAYTIINACTCKDTTGKINAWLAANAQTEAEES